MKYYTAYNFLIWILFEFYIMCLSDNFDKSPKKIIVKSTFTIQISFTFDLFNNEGDIIDSNSK